MPQLKFLQMNYKIFSSGIIASIICYFYLDKYLAELFYSYALKQELSIINLILIFGKATYCSAFLFILALSWNLYKPSAKLWLLFLSVFIPSAIALILKIILGRARPELLFSANSYGFYFLQFKKIYWSCPSGHTTVAFGLMYALAQLFKKFAKLFYLLALAIALSRVLMYYHYLSDIILTALLTVLELKLLYYLLKKYLPTQFKFLN